MHMNMQTRDAAGVCLCVCVVVHPRPRVNTVKTCQRHVKTGTVSRLQLGIRTHCDKPARQSNSVTFTVQLGAYLTAPASDVFCNTDGIGVFQAILLLGCFEVAQRNSIRNAGCSGSLKTSPGRDGHPKA